MIKKICVALFMSFVAGSIGLMNVPPANSQDNATINYFNDGLRQARSGWTNLTHEQRQVDHRIQSALQAIGKRSIPVTPENVTWMMQQIGANGDTHILHQYIETSIDRDQSVRKRAQNNI
jgi:hypothetical protein